MHESISPESGGETGSPRVRSPTWMSPSVAEYGNPRRRRIPASRLPLPERLAENIHTTIKLLSSLGKTVQLRLVATLRPYPCGLVPPSWTSAPPQCCKQEAPRKQVSAGGACLSLRENGQISAPPHGHTPPSELFSVFFQSILLVPLTCDRDIGLIPAPQTRYIMLSLYPGHALTRIKNQLATYVPLSTMTMPSSMTRSTPDRKFFTSSSSAFHGSPLSLITSFPSPASTSSIQSVFDGTGPDEPETFTYLPS